MDCCSVDYLDEHFDSKSAHRMANAYLKKGLDKRAKILADFLKSRDIEGRSILDVGCGVGSLHLELLKSGAGSATGVEVSSASVQKARELAGKLGFPDSVEYHIGDFSKEERKVAKADIVIEDRVVCCYPDMESLVRASARHAKELYAITYPRNTWWMHLGRKFMNSAMILQKSKFRFYVHDPREMNSIIVSEGFSNVFRSRQGVWEIAVFERN